MIALLAACGTTSPLEPPTDTTSVTGPPAAGPVLVVTDENISEYEGTWLAPRTPVSNEIDLYFSWDTLTVDAWEFARDPSSYAVLRLSKATGTSVDVIDALSLGVVEGLEVETWTTSVAGLTEASTADLGVDAADLDGADGEAWLLALCDVAGERLDARVVLLLEPEASDPGNFLTIPAASRYSFTSQFDGDALRTESGYEAYTVDFSAVTVDAQGNPFSASSVDEVFVGRYDDVVEGDDLASQVLALEAAASAFTTLPTGGDDVVEVDAAVFEAGIYLIGARCTTCLRAEPAFVVVVDVD